MKKRLPHFLSIGIVFMVVFLGCSNRSNQVSEDKVIRIAEQVPNLIYPPIWEPVRQS